MGQCGVQLHQKFIDVLDIAASDLQADSLTEAGLYAYPHRNFTLYFDLPRTRNTLPEDTGSQRYRFQVDSEEQVELVVRTYQFLSEELKRQTQGLEITHVLTDEVNVDRQLLLGRQQGKDVSLFLRTFSSPYDGCFLNIVYEVHTYQKIRQLRSPHLHCIQRHYCIEPTPILNLSYTMAVQLEPISSNLSLIIQNRRDQRKCWNFSEFYRLSCSLVEGVATLHAAGLTHNDIRPSTVYYSQQKDCFLLGCFSNVTVSPRDKLTKQMKESNHYKDCNHRRLSKTSQASPLVLADLYKSDVYSLGMTLLSAFYLCEPLDRKKSAPFNRALSDSYPFLQIIRMMITRIHQRSTIFEVRQQLATMNDIMRAPLLKEEAYLGGLQGKSTKHISEAYKSLGMLQKWRDNFSSRFILFLKQESVEAAKNFQELACISAIEGNTDKSNSQCLLAAQIYAKVGETHFENRQYCQAISSFKSGLATIGKLKRDGAKKTAEARLRVDLALAKVLSGWQLIEQEELGKLEKMTQAVKDIEVVCYEQLLLKLADIYGYYEDYDRVESLLSQLPNPTKVHQVDFLHRRIANLFCKATQTPLSSSSRAELLNLAHSQAQSILANHEYFFIQQPIRKAEIQLLLCQIQLALSNYTLAASYLQALRQKTAHLLATYFEGNTLQLANQARVLNCEVLTVAGDLNYATNQHSNALQCYSQALEDYRCYWGSHYNIQSARLFQRIAQTHLSRGSTAAYRDSLQLAAHIIDSQYGSLHKLKAGLSLGLKTKRSPPMTDRTQSHLEDA